VYVVVNKTSFLYGNSILGREVVLSVNGLSKRFGNVVALRNVDLELRSNEIHVLLGENGAGKTTLANIIYGIYRPDSGTIKFFGKEVNIRSPKDAISYGIVLVQQHPMLIERMTVAENLALGFKELGILSSPKTIGRVVREVNEKYGISVDPEVLVSNLSFSEKQQVELIRALLLNVKLLILDEPTTMLTSYERRKLFSILKKLVSDGRSILLITHKVLEALEVSDWITVLRRGEVVASRPKDMYSVDELVKLVVGDDGELVSSVVSPSKSVEVGGNVLEVKDLIVLNDVGGIAVNKVSINVRSGEIVGIAGVTGNGQKELSEAIAGLRRVRDGRILINGVDVTNKGPSSRFRAGLAYIPEERLKYGVVGDMSVTENLILKDYYMFSRFTLLRLSDAVRVAEECIKTFNIVTRGPSEKVKALSGGNIQKLIIARELRLNPKVVVAHNPTLGLDLRSTSIVHEQLLNIKYSGSGVLLISEDLDEVIKLSDRVLVMYRGTIVYEGVRGCSREALEKAMLGIVDV